MDYDEKIRIDTAREYKVVKANDLVQKSRFALSVPEQKTIAYICAMIKPIDPVDRANGVPFQLEYEFNIREYCKICGINYENGKNYADIKATLKRLSDRSMWLEIGDEEVLCRWLAKVRTNKKSGIVHVRIDEDLAPYLFDLQEKFLSYGLVNVLAMKSQFSIRLYELLKSYLIKQSVTKTFDLDELKRLLMVENVKSYSDFSLFRKKVLEIAEREINNFTDIHVSWQTVKKGKKVTAVTFRAVLKSPLERYQANRGVYAELDGIVE